MTTRDDLSNLDRVMQYSVVSFNASQFTLLKGSDNFTPVAFKCERGSTKLLSCTGCSLSHGWPEVLRCMSLTECL